MLLTHGQRRPGIRYDQTTNTMQCIAMQCNDCVRHCAALEKYNQSLIADFL